MKVSGTPSVYVNGEKFDGGLDFEALSDRIESAL